MPPKDCKQAQRWRPFIFKFFCFPFVFMGPFLNWFPFVGKRIGNSSLSFQFACNFHCSFILLIPSSLGCENQVRELLKFSNIYFVPWSFVVYSWKALNVKVQLIVHSFGAQWCLFLNLEPLFLKVFLLFISWPCAF